MEAQARQRAVAGLIVRGECEHARASDDDREAHRQCRGAHRMPRGVGPAEGIVELIGGSDPGDERLEQLREPDADEHRRGEESRCSETSAQDEDGDQQTGADHDPGAPAHHGEDHRQMVGDGAGSEADEVQPRPVDRCRADDAEVQPQSEGGDEQDRGQCGQEQPGGLSDRLLWPVCWSDRLVRSDRLRRFDLFAWFARLVRVGRTFGAQAFQRP